MVARLRVVLPRGGIHEACFLQPSMRSFLETVMGSFSSLRLAGAGEGEKGAGSPTLGLYSAHFTLAIKRVVRCQHLNTRTVFREALVYELLDLTSLCFGELIVELLPELGQRG